MTLNTESGPAESSAATPEPKQLDTAAQAVGEAAAADAPADSSPARQDAKDERTSLLDAVKSAIEPTDAPAQDSSTAKPEAKAESQAESTDPKPEGEQPAADGKGDENLPFHNHPRWKQVIAERDTYRQGAEQFEKITSFMESNGLTSQEVVDGFKVMALMKLDPAKALEELERFAAPLREFVGQVLPADLQSKVDSGLLDPDSARELAAARNKAKFAEERVQQVDERTREERAQAEAATLQQQMFDAVATWEEQVKSSDPDYATKQRFVVDRILVLRAQQPPRNAAEAVDIAKQAHKDVTEQLKSLSARTKREVRPAAPSTTDTSLVRGTPQPKTLAEVVRLAAQGA